MQCTVIEMQYATHYGRDAAVCNALIANLIIWLNKNQGKHSWPQSNSLYLFSGLRSLSRMPSCIRLVRVILVRVILAGRGLEARKLPTGDNRTIFGKKRGCYMLNCFTASHSPTPVPQRWSDSQKTQKVSQTSSITLHSPLDSSMRAGVCGI